MFSLFKKKEPERKIPEWVFTTTTAKWKALQRLAAQPNAPVFVAWFDETQQSFEEWLLQHNAEATVLNFKAVHSGITGNRPLVMIEHYPLKQKEQDLFKSLSNPVSIYSALDEAFFLHFGAEKITPLLASMGVDENEALSHSMITKAIAHAQEKLAALVTVDQTSPSMKEWMRKNVR